MGAILAGTHLAIVLLTSYCSLSSGPSIGHISLWQPDSRHVGLAEPLKDNVTRV